MVGWLACLALCWWTGCIQVHASRLAASVLCGGGRPWLQGLPRVPKQQTSFACCQQAEAALQPSHCTTSSVAVHAGVGNLDPGAYILTACYSLFTLMCMGVVG